MNDSTLNFGRSFRREVVNYIERCHLEDGGYFFARIPPSSGLDTYFAVKSLSILGVKHRQPEAVMSFLLNQMREDTLSDITGVFITVEVISELSQITDELKNYAQQRIMAIRNRLGGFGAAENIYVEVSSELEETYRAVKILKNLGADFDEPKVTHFVFSLLNPDGGYGRDNHSTLASTCYATEIHNLLGTDLGKLTRTRGYLRDRENEWRGSFDNRQVSFLEDLFWLVRGLASLGEKADFPDRVIRFVMACQRSNGGFSRATIMGIPTLEYTFYALSILSEVGAF